MNIMMARTFGIGIQFILLLQLLIGSFYIPLNFRATSIIFEFKFGMRFLILCYSFCLS